MSASRQEKKKLALAIVTGGNRGIGLAIVEALWAKKGYHTIIACRALASGEESAEAVRKQEGGGEVSVMQLDLCSMVSVRAFAEQVRSRHSRIDALFNNAGILRWRGWIVTKDGFEEHLQANFLGHYLLTKELLPLLLSEDGSNPSRVVSVGSHLGSIGRINFENLNDLEGFPAYQQSKLAQMLHMQELHECHSANGLLAFCMEPGEVNTDITRNFPFASLINVFLKFVPERNTPAQGADTAVWIGTCPPDDARPLSGKFLADRKSVDENYSGFTAFSSLVFAFLKSGEAQSNHAVSRKKICALADRLVSGEETLPLERSPKKSSLLKIAAVAALFAIALALLLPFLAPGASV